MEIVKTFVFIRGINYRRIIPVTAVWKFAPISKRSDFRFHFQPMRVTNLRLMLQ